MDRAERLLLDELIDLNKVAKAVGMNNLIKVAREFYLAKTPEGYKMKYLSTKDRSFSYLISVDEIPKSYELRDGLINYLIDFENAILTDQKEYYILTSENENSLKEIVDSLFDAISKSFISIEV